MAEPLTRRSFLKRSCTAAAMLPGVAAFAAEATGGAISKPIRIGFLGAAHSHAREKIKTVRESDAFELIGICEPNEQVRSRLALKNVPFLEASDLMEKSEAVAVESSVKDLAENAKRALAAGKHVHLEKPGAANLAAFGEILALARAQRRVLQLGYMWRYNPGFAKALEVVRKGWLGEIYLIRAAMNTLVGAAERAEWAQFKGGAMFEQGCHLIDPLVRLMGEPRKITSFLKARSDGDSLADNTIAVFEFGKVMAMVSDAALQPNAGPQRFFEILGTNGTAFLKPFEQPKLQIDLAKAAGPYQAGSQIVEFAPYRRYVGDFAAFADAIRNGKPLSVTLDEEQIIHRTLLRACEMEKGE